MKNILIAEDTTADVILVKRAFSRITLEASLHFVTDGVEALTYLHSPGRKPTLPDLVVLDIHMPKRSGLEVLREMRCDPQLKRAIVVLLSTSDSPADVKEAYELHANSYLVKPTDFHEFEAMMRAMAEYWLVWNRGGVMAGR